MMLLVGSGLLARNIAAVVGGASLTAWPSAVIGITVAALGPPAAQAADYWGRKPFMVIFTASGCIGCIITARASSMGMAIGGFTIASMSCVAQPLLHAVVSETLPRKLRSWAQATINVAVSLGAILGLLLGGALTRNSPKGFRTYFEISTGLYALSTISIALLYRPPPRETQKAGTGDKIRQLDWTGYLLIGSGVVLLCLGLAWAQNPYSWVNAHVLGPFLVGAVVLIVLILQQWIWKKDGLFHHDLFRNRNFAIALFCVYIEGSCAFASNYFVPFQLSTLYPGMTPFRVGLCYSVSYFTFFLFTLFAGFVIWKTKTVRLPVMSGFLGFLLYFIVAATSTPDTPQANFWAYMTFLGWGLGLLLTTLVVVAQLSTPPHLIAVASGLVLAIRSLGASTGLSIYQAIYAHGISKNLVPMVTRAVLPLKLPDTSLGPLLVALTAGNNKALADVPGVTPEIAAAAALAVQQAYNRALSYVWATAGAFVFVAMIVSAFIHETKAEFTAAIDAPLDTVVHEGNSSESDMKKAGD